MKTPEKFLRSKEAHKAPTFLDMVTDGLAMTFAPVSDFARSVGNHFILLAQAAFWAVRRPFRGRLFLEAADFIGVGSVPIIALVGGFTGMVTALQAVNQLKLVGVESYAGAATAVALATELGPVMTALMLSGRAGAGIATELGTMRITEQIDALETMAVSPVQYLVVPRVLIGMLITPILVLLFFGVGMLGAYLVAVKGLGVDPGGFASKLDSTLQMTHLVQGIIKALVFGMFFSLVGCFQGYHATGGGRGVGLATTRAVVIASVGILVLDYFLTDIILVVMPAKGGG